MFTKLHGNKGFTLIELLVVIAVLGILAAIAIPRLGGVSNKARLTEAVSFAGTFRQAQEMHDTEYGSYATSVGALSEYIDSDIPVEGWTELGYSLTTDGFIYIIEDGDLQCKITSGGVDTDQNGTFTAP